MDEVLAVGDNKFVPKALAVVNKIIANGNALLLASHSSDVIRANCSKAIWMRDGPSIVPEQCRGYGLIRRLVPCTVVADSGGLRW